MSRRVRCPACGTHLYVVTGFKGCVVCDCTGSMTFMVEDWEEYDCDGYKILVEVWQ